MKHFELRKEWDLTNYNQAANPWISIQDNGKVDIGKDFGDEQKISLQSWTIVRFIDEWLSINGSRLIDDEFSLLQSRLDRIKDKNFR